MTDAHRSLRLLIMAALLLAACTETATLDSGPADAGPSDASGIGDSSPADAGASDAGGGACGMECPVATPVCDASSGTCVECLGAGDCSAPTAMCDTATNLCVTCLADGDCTDPAAARCDAGACVPCTEAGQCVGIADRGLCETGACVECTIADEASCAGNSCDPATNLCTTTLLGLTVTCDPCVADSECVADHRCVPMTYMGAAHGDYCMEIASPSCARPFLSALADRISLSGAAEDDYCGIDESTVSCEAVRALQDSNECTADGRCFPTGEPGMATDVLGAICRRVGLADNRCTYACSSPDECLPSGPGRTCEAGMNYCGSLP